ncbi:MAG: ribosome silencing factor [Thiomicrospira sp.]|uniref:ribosome silencing factor n=1 Tax=Thiomicrospira sp. TaxID=935 RepID=UPI0019EA5054|nr:ribosome silencing factor [Thiomicrospira sp.]MBE0494194.1 ribosome silencing factor [Thiomicrospira sp.]
MDLQQIENIALKALDDGKARDVQVIDVAGISSFTDRMIVATGTSSTHVRSLGSMVDQAFKEAGDPSMGMETGPEPDWVLIDHGNLIVHVMTEKARAYYSIEKLWNMKLEATMEADAEPAEKTEKTD